MIMQVPMLSSPFVPSVASVGMAPCVVVDDDTKQQKIDLLM